MHVLCPFFWLILVAAVVGVQYIGTSSFFHANDSLKWLGCRCASSTSSCMSFGRYSCHAYASHRIHILAVFVLHFYYTHTHTQAQTFRFAVFIRHQQTEQRNHRTGYEIHKSCFNWSRWCYLYKCLSFLFVRPVCISFFAGSLNCRRHVIYWPYWAFGPGPLRSVVLLLVLLSSG